MNPNSHSSHTPSPPPSSLSDEQAAVGVITSGVPVVGISPVSLARIVAVSVAVLNDAVTSSPTATCKLGIKEFVKVATTSALATSLVIGSALNQYFGSKHFQDRIDEMLPPKVEQVYTFRDIDTTQFDLDTMITGLRLDGIEELTEGVAE